MPSSKPSTAEPADSPHENGSVGDAPCETKGADPARPAETPEAPLADPTSKTPQTPPSLLPPPAATLRVRRPTTSRSEQEIGTLRRRLRRFHLEGPSAEGDLPGPDATMVPAVLHPFRHPEVIRHDYPLVLFPADVEEPDRLCAPLAEVLAGLIEALESETDDLRLLRDNLARLEIRLRGEIDSMRTPTRARSHLANAARALEDALDLGGESARQLHAQLERLIDAMPEQTLLLGLTEHAPIHLAVHAARHGAATRWAALRAEAGELLGRLKDLLRIERHKGEAGLEPEAIAESVGSRGAEHFNPEALGRLLKAAQGSEPMPPQVRQRIEESIEILDHFMTRDERPQIIIVHAGTKRPDDPADDVQYRAAGEAGPCRVAASVFDEQAQTYVRLFGAMRLARLHLAGGYDPARHDAALKTFDWRAFSPEELLALPPVIAVESAEQLASTGMLDLSQLLLSGRVVQTIVIVRAAANPGQAAQEDPLHGYRFELGYLGMSHREAVVHQSSAARPAHLMDGYRQSLSAARASLHVVTSGLSIEDRLPPLGAWLHTGAALEGRAHPLFHYNPEAGKTWARRLDFGANPQPEADWPLYPLRYTDEEDEAHEEAVAFTFADFALMEQRFRRHFRLLPEDLVTESCVSLQAYLQLDREAALERIPFIWAADEHGGLHRLAVTRRLAFACRDRLDYWRTLQELAGIHNEHVREAVERERERLEAQFAATREKLETAHAADLEQTRRLAASEALERLAQSLLGTDVTAMASSVLHPPAATAPPPPAGDPGLPAAPGEVAAPDEPEAPQPEAAEEEDEGPEEPWIESALCTSCDDCMQINPQVFVYNANKQAVIGDAGAGTFAQLVQAAEKCPARCIHPGTPLNADEPDLPQLIERAKPFK